MSRWHYHFGLREPGSGEITYDPTQSSAGLGYFGEQVAREIELVDKAKSPRVFGHVVHSTGRHRAAFCDFASREFPVEDVGQHEQVGSAPEELWP